LNNHELDRFIDSIAIKNNVNNNNDMTDAINIDIPLSTNNNNNEQRELIDLDESIYNISENQETSLLPKEISNFTSKIDLDRFIKMGVKSETSLARPRINNLDLNSRLMDTVISP